MKHLPPIAFWAGFFGWLAISTYLDHVKQSECLSRGGTWQARGGCDPDYCEVQK